MSIRNAVLQLPAATVDGRPAGRVRVRAGRRTRASACRWASGANSVIAPAVVQASQLAADEINAAGGILGRQVVLEIADDASSAVAKGLTRWCSRRKWTP